MFELENIKGINNKKKELLSKLGIFTIQDLLMFYPYKTKILRKTSVLNLLNGDKIINTGIIETSPIVMRINYKLNRMRFKINIQGRIFDCNIFNRWFMKNELTVGRKIIIIGKYNEKQSSITLSDIILSEELFEERIERLYNCVSGITSNQIHNFIQEALQLQEVNDYVPNYLNIKYNFISKKDALKYIHLSLNSEEIKKAELKLKYEELFLFMIRMNFLKNKNKVIFSKLERSFDNKLVKLFINSLPFELTEDQKKSINKIIQDFTLENRMNRLIIGDVGSGKTIVSIVAAYINYLCGYQSVIMGPTEILSRQHYINFKNLFKEYDIKIELLVGSMTIKEKKECYKRIENGEAKIIIGTHAVIQDKVNFKFLGLVVTDEQHRFGVSQRNALSNKGIMPDVLYLSATPIPRTYALALYGDMDVSLIKTMPSGRQPIKTYVKNYEEITSVLKLIYNELTLKHQIYIVAPLVSESEKNNLENVESLREKYKLAFKNFKVEIIHGKLKSNVKDNIMNEFKKGTIDILISTTVIEVGIDVPNTTMIVIYDAERFGLSQLHQLRGRVGRNDLNSYCILISKTKVERLKIMEQTSDGFEISQADFKLRGSGDLFGIKQSGSMNFKIANISEDISILNKAKIDASEFFNKNFNNKEYQNIIDYIRKVEDLS
ncbi:MAG: ATP-dependent DNA helicase RecG [Bacilli bacterium]